MEWIFALLVAVLAVLAFALTASRRRSMWATVFEHQTGLRYTKGRLVETLGPGRYSLFWPGTVIRIEDLREQVLDVPGQEMLTADSLAVKVSLSLRSIL